MNNAVGGSDVALHHFRLHPATINKPDKHWFRISPLEVSAKSNIGTVKTQGGDVASFTYVYSLTGRTRLANSGTPAGLYTQRGDVDIWWITSGRAGCGFRRVGLADFLGVTVPPTYVCICR